MPAANGMARRVRMRMKDTLKKWLPLYSRSEMTYESRNSSPSMTAASTKIAASRVKALP